MGKNSKKKFPVLERNQIFLGLAVPYLLTNKCYVHGLLGFFISPLFYGLGLVNNLLLLPV